MERLIIHNQDVVGEILLNLELTDLLNLGLVAKSFAVIRTSKKYDRVWRHFLYKTWLFQTNGSGVFQSYLTQFQNVIVFTESTRWSNNRIVLPKIEWECYRDFILLGDRSFACKSDIENAVVLTDKELVKLCSQAIITDSNDTLVHYLEEIYPESLSNQKALFGYRTPETDYKWALEWWKKQYQIMRAIHAYLPPDFKLIARNDMSEGLAGPVIRNLDDQIGVTIEDRQCMQEGEIPQSWTLVNPDNPTDTNVIKYGENVALKTFFRGKFWYLSKAKKKPKLETFNEKVEGDYYNVCLTQNLGFNTKFIFFEFGAKGQFLEEDSFCFLLLKFFEFNLFLTHTIILDSRGHRWFITKKLYNKKGETKPLSRTL